MLFTKRTSPSVEDTTLGKEVYLDSSGVISSGVRLSRDSTPTRKPVTLIVGALREPIGVYCADLSTSVKFDTEVDQSILISFFEGAKAGAHWGRHIS